MPGFLREASALTLGTAAAQLLMIGSIPLLTRLYGAADFGASAVFNALMGVLAVIATARYEFAITLPERHEEAQAVALIGVVIASLVSLTLLLIIVVCLGVFTEAMAGIGLLPWLLLLPWAVFFAGVFSVVQLWNNRISAYRSMAMNQLRQALFVVGISLLLGVLGISGGLIIGIALGWTLSALWALQTARAPANGLFRLPLRPHLRSMAMRYHYHATRIAPSQLLGVVAVQLPVLLISSVYSASLAGYYSIANRVASLPTVLVANALGDVYRQRVSEQWYRDGQFSRLFALLLFFLAVAGMPVFVLLYGIAPWLFPQVLGAEWVEAAPIARVLLVGGYVTFIFTPLDKGAMVVGASLYIVLWQLLRLALFVSIAAWAGLFAPPFLHLLWALVVSGILLNLIDGIYEYKFSTGRV